MHARLIVIFGWAASVPAASAAYEHRVSLVGDIASLDYSETLPSPQENSERGMLMTVGSELAWLRRDWQFALRSGFSSSRTKYKGGAVSLADPSQVTPVTRNTRNLFFHSDFESAWAVDRSTYGDWIVFSGLRYSFWRRSDGKTVPGDYREFFHWLVLPIGVGWLWHFAEDWRLKAKVSFEWGIFSHMKALLADGNELNNLGDVSQRGPMRWGLRLEMPISYRFTDRVGLSVTPWFEYVRVPEFQETDLVTNTGIATGLKARTPISRTFRLGTSLAVDYFF